MKTKTAAATFCLTAIATMASGSALAAPPESGWYIGGNVGESRSRIDDERIVKGLASGGFATNKISDDEGDIGFKVYGGYQFHPYFALESGYFDLGKFSFDATTTPPGTLHGDIHLRGVNLDAVVLVPLTPWMSVFGRGGGIYAEAKDRFSGTGAVHVQNPNRRERAGNYKFGAGLQFALTDNLGLRAEAERYRVNDGVGNKGDVDLFSAGLLYRFGGPKPVPVAHVMTPEPTPEPMAAAAPVAPPVYAPAPVVAPPPPPAAPPPVMPKRVSFSADSLFDFDKSTVKAAGKEELEEFAAKLRGTRFDVINVTGHSDRIGSHEYNQKLSERRADAVKDYLVQTLGVPANRIVARGVDGSDPVTKGGQCTGRERPASPALIACLQPDRRVEVEVTGTK